MRPGPRPSSVHGWVGLRSQPSGRACIEIRDLRESSLSNPKTPGESCSSAAVMLQHPEPHFRRAGEVVSAIHRQAQVEVAPANQIGCRSGCLRRRQEGKDQQVRGLSPDPNFQPEQVWTAGGIGLHQASGNIAPRHDAELRLVRKDRRYFPAAGCAGRGSWPPPAASQ